MKYKGWALLWLLLLSSCGFKDAPQIAEHEQATVTPQIVDLHYEVTGPALKLEFVLQGNPAGVGYQIDRTEVDPYCQCPGMWRRYYEQEPYAKQVGERLTKLLNLRTREHDFLFRIRAVDVDGHFGPWSEPIRAHAVDLMRD